MLFLYWDKNISNTSLLRTPFPCFISCFSTVCYYRQQSFYFMNLYRVYLCVYTLTWFFWAVIKLISQQFYCFHQHNFHALGRELLVTGRVEKW